MQISYDPIADAMYIALTKKNRSTLTEPVREDFLVDFNKGKLIGIEILDVSQKMPNFKAKLACSMSAFIKKDDCQLRMF